MPELPEVETVMRGLRARLEGRVIVRALVHRPDLRWALPPGLAARLTGARVESFRRRAKYILMRLDGGDSVLLHLGMSGRMVLGPLLPNSVTLHEHIVLETEDGWRVGFVDPRRFGSVDLIATAREDEHRLLAGLGPEPLADAFSTAVLARALAGKRTPVKAALLDQRLVAGLGNIYVCEALFRARIAPDRQAATIPRAGAARLVRAIKATLTEAIAAGGSSCGTTCSRTANSATSSTPGRCMAAKANPASAVPARPLAPASHGWCNPRAPRSTAPARNADGAPRRKLVVRPGASWWCAQAQAGRAPRRKLVVRPGASWSCAQAQAGRAPRAQAGRAPRRKLSCARRKLVVRPGASWSCAQAQR